jgi:hypothetical protein
MDLSTLQSVLAPLATVGKDEREFSIEGQTIVVRPLLPHEEVAVQRFAVASLDEIKEEQPTPEDQAMSRADALDYFDRFRIEVIAHSIVEINGTDLRNVEYIATGETTSSGVEVKVLRAEAMRKIIRENWSRTMVTGAFTQYGELIEALGQKADGIAVLAETDLEVEIERVTERLKELKKQRKDRAKGDSAITKEQVEHFVGMGERQEEATQQLIDHHKKQDEAKEAAEKAKAARLAAAEEARTATAAPPVIEEPAPQAPVKPSEPTPSFEAARSSFEDGEDPEVVMAEQMRILEARKAAQEKERQRLQQGSVPSKAPSVDGIETYRMPTEELSPRGKPAHSSGKVPELDPTSRGELNPKFGRK